MGTITLKTVASGAKLLKQLIKKVDNGDGTLTAKEAKRAFGVRRGVALSKKRAAELQAVTAAINKVKVRSDRSVDSIVSAVDSALKEVKTANADGSTSLSDAEAKKVKTSLGKQLVEFSRMHSGETIGDIKLAPPPPEYRPSKPFKAPSSGGTPAWVEAGIRHFNGFSNDNSPGYTLGRGTNGASRWVYGITETKGLAAEIAKLPPAAAKAALRELSKRIHQPDFKSAGWEPKRLYVEPKAQPLLTALAKKLGITVDVKGDPKAPTYDYF